MKRNITHTISKLFIVILLLIISSGVIWAASNNQLPLYNFSINDSNQTESYNENSYLDISNYDPDTSKIPVNVDFSTYLINIKNKDDYSDYVITDLVYSYKDNYILAFAKSIIKENNIKSITPRMGFIFVTYNDESISLLDSNGDVIFDKIPDGYTFTGVRDYENRPLFSFENKYYYLDDYNIFVLSEYDEGRYGRGINFDYPSYYGASDGTIKRFGKSLWGLKNNSITLLSALFSNVYFYSEDICSAVYYGKLYFYRYKEYVAFSKQYLPPLTTGIESLGYFYFDHGLTRVRSESNGISKELLMYSDGTLFQLPQDFELVSYYNGILTLKKDDKYGYMKYTGEWITNPSYKYAGSFIEGVAVVSKGDKFGLIDTYGNQILPEVFDYISNCSSGVIVLYEKDNGYYIINKMKQQEHEVSEASDISQN